MTFANHEGSTRSFEAVRARNVQLQELGFVQPQSEIKVEYAEGESRKIALHDGSRLLLRKLASDHHDVTDRLAAFSRLHEARAKGEFLTGLFYWDKESRPLGSQMGLVERPLARVGEESRPAHACLDEMMARFA